MENVLAATRAIDRVLSRIASAAGWLFLVLTAVIAVDVVTRRYGYQFPNFGSTRLQELEGHLHAALFALWLGYAYVRNAHVRIDIAVARADARTRALTEFLGCALLALPFAAVAFYFSTRYAWTSYLQNEASVSASGLPYLFIPKAVLAMGLALLLAGVVSVMLRTAFFLYGPPHLREQAAPASYRMGADD